MMNPFRFALPRALSDEARAAARHELGLGRCAFLAKDYAQARSRFERAAELGPTEVIASLLVARTIRVQYRKGVETKANVALARAAIAAYEHVLVRDCDNSEAILAVADLYEQTGEEDTALDWLVNHSPRSSAAIMGVARLHRERRQDDKAHAWLIEHASMESVAVRARVQIYVSLAGDGWACSHRITSKPSIGSSCGTTRTCAAASRARWRATCARPSSSAA